jgi:hypothetical protein
MDRPTWAHISLSGGGPVGHKLQRLPTGSAIYAFCPTVKLPPEKKGLDLLEHLQRLCETPYGPDIAAWFGPYARASLSHHCKRQYGYLKKESSTLTTLEDEAFLKCLNQALEAAQELVPPYYIGETENLQRRIRDHLATNSDLRVRLSRVGIDIQDLTVRYFLLSSECGGLLEDDRNADSSEGSGEAASFEDDMGVLVATGLDDISFEFGVSASRRRRLLIEEVLSRLCRPRYIEKLGTHFVGSDPE